MGSNPGPSAPAWFIYIVLCSDNSYYVGSTSDLDARFKIHQSGKGPAYIAARLPVKLVYSEPYASLEDAMKRERQLKGWTHAKKAALISGELQQLHALSRRRK